MSPLSADGMKVCVSCTEEKPVSEFGRRVASTDGLAFRCKPCMRDYSKAIYAKNPEKYRADAREYNRKNPNRLRSGVLQKLYGITVEDYAEMLEAQGGGCAICGIRGEDQNGRVKNLAVDHDHATGAVRGLLCHLCNRALGLLQDSPEQLRRALQYLEKNR